MLPEDFLELALSRAVDANTLTEFLRASNEQRRVGAEGEGLFHDFKSGKLFELTGEKLREEKRELRRDLVGFANSAGGVLLLGVDQGDKRNPPLGWKKSKAHVDGVKLPPADIESLLSELVGPVRHQLHARPVETVVTHPDGNVWLIATDRHTGTLLHVDEKGSQVPVFPMRVGDSTCKLHPQLVTDLLVGRRAQPEFALTATIDYELCKTSGRPSLQWVPSLRIENTSPRYADEVVVSVVMPKDPHSDRTPRSVYRNRSSTVLTADGVGSLARHLDLRGRSTEMLTHSFAKLGTIPGFGYSIVRFDSTWHDVNAERVEAAVVVMCRDGYPALFQLAANIPRSDIGEPRASLPGRPGEWLSVARCARPVVDYSGDHRVVMDP